MHKFHEIRDLSIKGSCLHMLVDGSVCDVDLAKESSCFANATQKQLEHVDVSPSGYGLYWPDLDEDLSVDGLIQNRDKSHLMVAEGSEEYVTKTGFTLLEVLVAMAILMMIVLMMSVLFQQSNMAWNNGLRQAEMSIQARGAMSLIRRDLSQAVAPPPGEDPCSFGSGGFTVYVMGTTTGDVRSIKKVEYTGSISRKVTDYEPSNGGGYFGNSDSDGAGDILDTDTFRLTYPSGFSTGSNTNLPAWVDISITLSKGTEGAAGIKVWSNGRDKKKDTDDDKGKGLRTWTENI